jgi:hypothetical protein
MEPLTSYTKRPAISSNRLGLLKTYKKFVTRDLQKKIYMNGAFSDYSLYISLLNYKKRIVKFSLIQLFLELGFYVLVFVDVNKNFNKA